MMRRILATSLLLAALLPSTGTAFAAKEYSADRFDVDIAVQPDGSLRVTETVVFRFSGEPFTFVFRELPTGYTDGITDLVASMDGVALPAGKDAGQVEISGSNPIKIRWHFAPTTNTSHTFVLSYRVLGVIRQAESADALYWNALPPEHEYTIRSSTVSVTYPSQAILIEEPSVLAGTAQVAARDGRITFEAHDIGRDSTLRFGLYFQSGSMIAAPPAWQARQARIDQTATVFVAAAAIVLAVGVAGLVLYGMRQRRPPLPVTSSFLRATQPPTDVPPAVAGALASSSAGIGWMHALGTLFDLARRGFLSIEERSERKWYRQRNFALNLLNQPADLRPHERGLLNLLFVTKKGLAISVKLSDVGSRLTSGLSRFSTPLKREMEAAGLISPERQAVRRRLAIFGAVTIAVGVVTLILDIVLAREFGVWPILVSVAVFFVGFIALFMAMAFSPLSAEGAQQAAQWKLFRAYLRDVTRGREPVVESSAFAAYLPYAASLGLAEAWAKFFQKQGVAEIPVWFQGLVDSGSTAAFVAMIAASSSAGGAAGAAAAAGGAAGGGASGAG